MQTATPSHYQIAASFAFEQPQRQTIPSHDLPNRLHPAFRSASHRTSANEHGSKPRSLGESAWIKRSLISPVFQSRSPPSEPRSKSSVMSPTPPITSSPLPNSQAPFLMRSSAAFHRKSPADSSLETSRSICTRRRTVKPHPSIDIP